MGAGDIYIERMVIRRPTARIRLIQTSCWLAVPVLTLLCWSFPATSAFAIFVLAGSCYGAWRLSARQNLEFEYALTGGELDVDKIMARRSRKRLLSIDCRKFDILAPATPDFAAEMNDRNVVRRLDVSSSSESAERWFAVFMDKENRRTILFFEPDQRMLDVFRNYIPRKIRRP